MCNQSWRRWEIGLLIAGMLFLVPWQASAQFEIPGGFNPSRLQTGGGNESTDNLLRATAKLTPADDGAWHLQVTANLQPGWYIYSITQEPGGPVPTKITVEPSTSYRIVEDFRADTPPKKKSEPLFGGLTVETHHDAVTWTARVELDSGAQPSDITIKGQIRAQLCTESMCRPPERFAFTASVDSVTPSPQAAGNGKPENLNSPVVEFDGSNALRENHIVWQGAVSPRVATPGSTLTLELEAAPHDGWHIYGQADRDPNQVGSSKPTLIILQPPSGITITSRPATDAVLKTVPSPIFPDESVEYYSGTVRWTAELSVSPDTSPGVYPLVGYVGYQTCTDSSCDQPRGAQFRAELRVGTFPEEGEISLQWSSAKYGEVALLAENSGQEIDDTSTAVPGGPQDPAGPEASEKAPGSDTEPTVVESSSTQILTYLGIAFLAGLILNVMPCVLPVVGLKILAFVQQAGENRGRIFMLNLYFAAGLMSVFLVLATLAVTLQMGWGEQFQSSAFRISLIGLVWVCALSLLGIWEIPIPGFAASSAANELAMKEGPFGAFAKGILSTLLATPCAGPLLVPAMTWASVQSSPVIFATFVALGLGMAAPYLLIGAFPQMIRFLPKPGAWMDTFKQFMGFVLLGTVAFLFGGLRSANLVATFTLLIGLWAGCWWIGKTPFTAEWGTRLRAWAVGLAVAGAVGVFAFWPSSHVLEWQEFSRSKLNQLTSEGQTVLVDFTASWCVNCQFNKMFALDTEETRQLLDDYDVVPLLADKTDEAPEIDALLMELGNASKAIPYLAIFPGGNPSQPIVLDGVLTKGMVAEAVKQAVDISESGSTQMARR